MDAISREKELLKGFTPILLPDGTIKRVKVVDHVKTVIGMADTSKFTRGNTRVIAALVELDGGNIVRVDAVEEDKPKCALP